MRDLIWQFNLWELKISYMARGSYHCGATCDYTTYPVNRLLALISDSGSSYNFIDCCGTRLELSPGNCYIVPAFQPAWYRLDSDSRFISVHFNLEFLPGIDLFARLETPMVFSDPDIFETLDSCFSGQAGLMSIIKLKQLLWGIASKLPEDKLRDLLKSIIFFERHRKVIDFIDANCNAQLRVSELAALENMSRAAFTRKFTSDTGISPKQLVNSRLMRRISHLLHKPGISVKEVAAELNFSSEYVFSRFCRREFGLPPGKLLDRERNWSNISIAESAGNENRIDEI